MQLISVLDHNINILQDPYGIRFRLGTLEGVLKLAHHSNRKVYVTEWLLAVATIVMGTEANPKVERAVGDIYELTFFNGALRYRVVAGPCVLSTSVFQARILVPDTTDNTDLIQTVFSDVVAFKNQEDLLSFVVSVLRGAKTMVPEFLPLGQFEDAHQVTIYMV